ncbi:DUF4129 domain-containing protein [Halopiger xanaduensis]|uniref:Protein-glutamine gamma-glutamyltransferase-like C-terminal domain-containing protein n=1 Tax=Halopiger xanaduensis (strain DSM 18323 / JCM 14033 / SH-6) TaxID=797210 RepID=F8DAH3_HALXS|nr:DUF4129 domain-containing protein [Halopiger xanaduensis]AEH35778.1 hypothetical protein Halxa_1145 [Halopiger xanaduensis SH-6]
MGSEPTEASDESVDPSAASATGPDWGQVALVLLAAAILALAAVTIPPLGGVGFQGQGPAQPAGEEDSSGLLQLGSGGSGGGSGDQQLGSGGSGSEGGAGDSGEPGSADGSGSDSLEDGAGSGGSGEQSGEAGSGSSGSGSEAGSGTSSDAGPGSDSDSGSGSEVGDGAGQQDGTAGGQSGDGSDAGSADGDGTGEPSRGEFGSGSGDGTAGEPGEGTADEPGGRSDGTGTDGQGTAGDGTTSGDGDGDSSGERTSGSDSEAGDGAGHGDGGDGDADGDGNTTGDGDSGSSEDSDDGGDPSESDAQDSSDGDGNEGGDSSDDSEDTDEAGEDDSGDEDNQGTTYDISFDEQPTPGSTVAVTVTGDGDPVEGATVYFNDEQVGTTDADGTVTGEVPYAETLEVRADVSPTETETTTARGSASVSGPALPGLGSSRQFHGAVAMPLSAVQDSQAGNETGDGARTTVEMNPETALTIDGGPIAGTNVTVVATVNGNPIPQGTVTVDNEAYGTTDDDGAAVIPVPETPGNATIAVERGEIRAERTIAVEALSLTVDDRFPLPGRSVDARLEYGNESVANATILVDGAAAATTGADGAATVGLPLADRATITAEYEGARATTTVDGLYRNAALLVLAVVVGALLLWRLAARYDAGDRLRSLPSPTSLLERLGDALRTLGRRTVDAIVRVARSLESFGYWVAGRTRAVVRALERAGRWLVALPGELATKGLAALAALHPIRLYRFLRDAIRSLLRSSRERVDDVSGAVTGANEGAAAGDEETDEDVRTLRELWAEFVQLVRPPRLRTKTPGEVGRYAVEKGFPEPPVRTVVDAFRDGEYGETAPSEDRLERVRAAVRSVTGDGDDGRDREVTDEDGNEPDGDRR